MDWHTSSLVQGKPNNLRWQVSLGVESEAECSCNRPPTHDWSGFGRACDMSQWLKYVLVAPTTGLSAAKFSFTFSRRPNLTSVHFACLFLPCPDLPCISLTCPTLP
ncbi:unnamed protein product [Protopolystoma xenopodis]|uniref:Uncharacterized protein n=1 Tax=Protopolystoma xenopodis TaxID=117903 RepID=A0A3S5AQ01_9PLAT|nr:unnamed protein product [Protopolystoma xenopodis]